LADRIVTVGASGRDYTAVSSAIAGEADFQAGEDNIVFEIDAGTYSAEIVLSSGFTTASGHRLVFRPASGATHHNFVRSQGVRVVGQRDWGALVNLSLRYIEFHDIAVSNTSSSQARGIYITTENVFIINCYVYDCALYGIYNNNVSTVFVNTGVVNCGTGIQHINGGTCRLYNCVFLNNDSYGFHNDTWGGQYFINCYSGGSGTADYSSPNTGSTLTTCRSEDGSLSTTQITIANCDFDNSTDGSEDLKIGADSDLINIGTDCTSDANFPFDYDGTGADRATGASTWDIGVFEYVSSGGTSHLVGIMQAINQFNGGMV
jgi:hypothetical protein